MATSVLPFGDPRLPDRFWDKVSPIPFPTFGATGCWVWIGSATSKGYGSFFVGTRAGKQVTGVAHKMTYRALHGRYRTKRGKRRMVLDHRCRTRCCVNPDHLELVPEPVNVRRGESMAGANARKTHCPKGHPYDDKNTYRLRVRSRGRDTTIRYCRLCRKK